MSSSIQKLGRPRTGFSGAALWHPPIIRRSALRRGSLAPATPHLAGFDAFVTVTFQPIGIAKGTSLFMCSIALPQPQPGRSNILSIGQYEPMGKTEMHLYFNRRADRPAAAEAPQVITTNVLHLNIAGPAATCQKASSRTPDATGRAVAMRAAFKHRLTPAQLKTINIMEAYGTSHAKRRAPGQVVAFRKCDRR